MLSNCQKALTIHYTLYDGISSYPLCTVDKHLFLNMVTKLKAFSVHEKFNRIKDDKKLK